MYLYIAFLFRFLNNVELMFILILLLLKSEIKLGVKQFKFRYEASHNYY